MVSGLRIKPSLADVYSTCNLRGRLVVEGMWLSREFNDSLTMSALRGMIAEDLIRDHLHDGCAPDFNAVPMAARVARIIGDQRVSITHEMGVREATQEAVECYRAIRNQTSMLVHSDIGTGTDGSRGVGYIEKEICGLRVKARPDFILRFPNSENSVIVEMKTVSASKLEDRPPRWVPFGAPLQLGFYCAIFRIEKAVVLVASSKEARWIEFDAKAISIAALRLAERMSLPSDLQIPAAGWHCEQCLNDECPIYPFNKPEINNE